MSIKKSISLAVAGVSLVLATTALAAAGESPSDPRAPDAPETVGTWSRPDASPTGMGLEPWFYGRFAVGVEGGNGTDDSSMLRGLLRYKWRYHWFDEGLWYATGHWELDAAEWRTDYNPSRDKSLYELGLTPVFRYMRRSDKWVVVTPYLEAGVGAHWLSAHTFSGRELSTRFQFGDHAGAGVMFGLELNYEIGYRWQHLSNGGIDEPNDGVAFNLLHFAYHF